MPDLNLAPGMELVRVPKWTPGAQHLKVPCGIRARPPPSGRWAAAGVPECLRFRSFTPGREKPPGEESRRPAAAPRGESRHRATPAPGAPALLTNPRTLLEGGR